MTSSLYPELRPKMGRQPKREIEKEQKIGYLLHDRITPERGKIVWLQQGKEKIKKHSLLP